MVVLTYSHKLFDTFPSPPHECGHDSNKTDKKWKAAMLQLEKSGRPHLSYVIINMVIWTSCSPRQDATGGHSIPVVFFPQSPKPQLNSKKTSDKPSWRTLYKIHDQCSSKQASHKKQVKAKKLSWIEIEYGDRTTKCNIVHGLDPGTEKEHWWKNWGNLNKVCHLVNSIYYANVNFFSLVNVPCYRRC